ncbi:MAG: tRNA-(ms[2]io[6]A)-hydroxylase [Bacteroidota bacterium]
MSNPGNEEKVAFTMLGLKLPTDPRWVNLAEIALEEILTDHAYCEQKAAVSCISLIQGFPDKIELVKALSPIVTEEWGHFRMVLAEIERRQFKLGTQRKDEYVNQLIAFQQKGGSREDRLLDKLLFCGLIEARSCERFRLLHEYLPDPHLKDFYYKFMVSEAGHYVLFLDLARLYFPEEKVKLRWQAYLQEEALIMNRLTLKGSSIH